MQENQITASEWEVMRVVWANKQTTSKYISEVLEDKMNWKPATTKTLIGRLVKKNKLSTIEEGRKYLYSPQVTEQECIQESSKEVLQQVCSKKRGSVLYQMIEDTTVSIKDIEKMQKLLEEKKTSAPEVILCQCTPGQCNCSLS
ncbi:CopY/TcrY family copper transport repressor [Marinilactibacillus psychrotolerans]|uniref:CopY/TcrY family copper transport repressor n=2 Tax=Marinilactibacillus psychrotolerans TaxID=191770 RepID=A0ABW8ULN9_9LACT|nr:CopY/TcrY family copper transport repressor [Marinilactibacillus psychrotolerans]GEQ33853.1 CopY/TcrY family copper transport repressor [Marinilactibacillus psychrotolerans]SJN29375.1 Negative transcriptional regulator-copper transport operon [Marinilactibacillus psychrotolerans 42ea]